MEPICISAVARRSSDALARRTRALMLTEPDSQRIWASFEGDVDDGIFDVLPVDNDDLINARRLIDAVAPLPLKHSTHFIWLSSGAHERDGTKTITSDAQQAAAAAALGIATKTIALTL